MKLVVCLAILSSLLVGCATMGLDEGATKEEKRAAMCLDAQTALLTAETVLNDPSVSDLDVLRYWRLFQAGAQIGIQTYCGAKSN